jgi:hypothetical protein
MEKLRPCISLVSYMGDAFVYKSDCNGLAHIVNSSGVKLVKYSEITLITKQK